MTVGRDLKELTPFMLLPESKKHQLRPQPETLSKFLVGPGGSTGFAVRSQGNRSGNVQQDWEKLRSHTKKGTKKKPVGKETNVTGG